MDYEAIGAALAAQFTGTTPPTGERAIVTATDDLPSQAGATPVLLVFPGPETFSWEPNKTRVSHQTWTVRLLLAQDGDFTRRMARLAKWRPALIDRVATGHVQLGLSYVDYAELQRLEPIEIDYAGTNYDGLEMTFDARIREQVAAQA